MMACAVYLQLTTLQHYNALPLKDQTRITISVHVRKLSVQLNG